MSDRRRAKNYLLPVMLAVYVLTLALMLSELDRQYYQREKETLIKYNFRELFPHDTVRLQELSRRILMGARVDGGQEALWRQEARGMLAGQGCVFRIRIVSREGADILAVVDQGKFRALNDARSTLFYRNFENVVSYEIAGEPGEAWVGLLSFHYTTPEAYVPVIELTNRYRLIALLLAAVVTVPFVFVVRKLVIPVRRVIGRIDAAADGMPELMTAPATMLERAYNELARDALLLRVTQSLRDSAAGETGLDRGLFLARIPGVLVDLMGYRAVVLFQVSPGAPGQGVEVLRQEEATADGYASADLVRLCAEVPSVEVLDALCPQTPVRLKEDETCVVCEITQDAELPVRTLLALVLAVPRRFDGDLRAWHCQTATRLAGQLREELAHVDLQRRNMRSERSRANVNLARNLGHDLTTIIATSKLGILTVKKILADRGDEDEEEPRGRLLEQSVQGLLNNAQLLQEVVNIYRSFSYINRPCFEWIDVNEMLEEILSVFSLSLPRKITLVRCYGAGLPRLRAEPRLLKLAVFNVLTNAVDAIKRAGHDEGLIRVVTALDDAGALTIAIHDNGPGIRNAAGRLATQAEIDEIFRYGVTTRTEEGGEGLGLSWVWTIVEEFHGGRVEAGNAPDGGAQFVMRMGVDEEDGATDEDSAGR